MSSAQNGKYNGIYKCVVIYGCFNKENHALLGQPPVQTDRNIHKLSLIFRRQGKTRIGAIIGRHLLRYIWNVSTVHTYIYIYISYINISYIYNIHIYIYTVTVYLFCWKTHVWGLKQTNILGICPQFQLHLQVNRSIHFGSCIEWAI